MTDIRDFEAYAREVIAAKGQDSKDLQLLESTKRVIRQAFSTTYHAVALDIDGTITEAGDRRIPEDLAISLSEKLNNGIYLILVTGGGVSTVEDTVEQFLQYNKERRKWRIYAIIGEGCRLLTIDAYGKVNDQSISPPLKSLLKESYPDFLNTLKSEFETEFEIQEKECTIRMLSKGNSTEQELKAKIQAWYTTASEDVKVANIRPVAGRYGGKLTFDIAASDKDVGLLRFYTDYDFADIPILRIGDQGGEEGNDWSLLDSAYGFSVGTLSNQPCKSFPIFNEDQNHRRLLGVEGTRYLLDKVKWSRRLILPSSLVKDSSFDYWEALRLIGLDAENKIKYAISKWTEDAKGFFDKETLDETVSKRFGNIFDNESGAVWLTEIEWYKVNTHPLYSFFTTRKESATCNECPNLERALYLDYGIILRGSKYYWGLANETNEYLASKIADETLDLHRLLLNLEIKLDPKGTMHNR